MKLTEEGFSIGPLTQKTMAVSTNLRDELNREDSLGSSTNPIVRGDLDHPYPVSKISAPSQQVVVSDRLHADKEVSRKKGNLVAASSPIP